MGGPHALQHHEVRASLTVPEPPSPHRPPRIPPKRILRLNPPIPPMNPHLPKRSTLSQILRAPNRARLAQVNTIRSRHSHPPHAPPIPIGRHLPDLPAHRSTPSIT